MNIKDINEFLVKVFSENRNAGLEEMNTYFTILRDKALTMSGIIDKLYKLEELHMISESILNKLEKETITEAVEFIINNTQNFEKDLNFLYSSGILENIGDSRSHVMVTVRSIINMADEIYLEDQNYFKLWFMNAKAKAPFKTKLEEAGLLVTNKASSSSKTDPGLLVN